MPYFSMIPSDDSKKKIQKDSGDIFSDSDIQEIVDLGNVLMDIRVRMISEGWVIKDHVFTSPEGVSYTKETMHLYQEEKEKKRKAELKAKRQRKNG